MWAGIAELDDEVPADENRQPTLTLVSCINGPLDH